MTIVVLTGATGLCGQAIVRRLKDLTGVRLVTTGRRALGGHHVVHGLEQPLPVGGSGFPERADVVIHAAAEVDERSSDTAILERNLRSTASVADYARAAGVRQLIHLSSVSVYGSASGRTRFDEGSPTAPATPYAHSKLLSEELLAERCGAPVVQLRLAYVLGRGLAESTIIRRFEKALRGGEEIRLINADENRLQFVAASDVAEVCAKLMAGERAALVNLAGNDRPTIREVLNAIRKYTGLEPAAIAERHDYGAIHDVSYDGSAVRRLIPGFDYQPFPVAIRDALQ